MTSSKDNWQKARQAALEQFRAQGFPSRREESWKYTDLSCLTEKQIQPCQQGTKAASKISSPNYVLAVIDGRADLSSSSLPDFVRISDAGSSRPVGVQPGHVALNTAHALESVLIHLPDNAHLDRALEIQYISTDGAVGGIYTQVWCELGRKASATLIERFIGGHGEHFCSHVNRISLAEEARLNHYKLQCESVKAFHLYVAYLELQSHSFYQSFSSYTGAALSRQESHVRLLGEHASCDQRGVTIGARKQHHDAYWPVEHAKPNCASNQHFRQILKGESKGVFYGSVHVPKHSCKTKAHQLNRNLLLSPKAQAISRPELKIFNDDLVCSHGSTTGSLDASAMYYLRTRGLTEQKARVLLMQGFLDEMLLQIESEYVRNLASAQLLQAMSEP